MASQRLQADNITWQVDNKVIVDGISFAANCGEVVGIVGPNGAGKTSLLKCLYQEHTVDSGNVTLDDMPLNLLSRKEVAQKVAVVGQQYDAIFALSVSDIVAMGLIPHKSYFERDTDQDRKSVTDALIKVDLLDKREQVFSTLSGGEQQRCMIARALVQQPKLLIMDEPTNHLDIYYQHQILSFVKELGLSVVMTIHDLNLAAQYCDRLLLIHQGRALAFAEPEQVLTEALIKEVFHLDCLVDEHPMTQKLRVSFAGVQP